MIALEDVGDGEHEIEGAAVVAASGNGAALQGLAQLQEIQFRQPVALLKGGNGVVLLEGGGIIGETGTLRLDQSTQNGTGALEESEQRDSSVDAQSEQDERFRLDTGEAAAAA